MIILKKNKVIILLAFIVFAFLFLFSPNLASRAFAHCDTMSGPVIQAAQKALETGNVDLVLIWVKEKDEAEIKEAFENALTERKLNPQNQEAIDMQFFQTLVRVHREGEGEEYTGIKPEGTEVEPIIAAVDEAVESGSVSDLVMEISDSIASEIEERFNKVIETKRHMNESVQAGREYVEAYVTFVHYVEKLHKDVSLDVSHHDESEGEEAVTQHVH